MPLDGNGLYTPPTPEYPAIANTDILASDFNAIILDLAATLNNTFFRDGQAQFTADIDAGGFKLSNFTTDTQATTDNSTKPATTAFVNAVAFSAALPGQVGNAGKLVTTDGTNAGWTTFTASQLARTDADNTLAGTQTLSGKSIIEANGTVAAHATTMNPWLSGNYVTLTGDAVTFTGLANAPQAGAEVELYMNAAHVFTHGAVFEVDEGLNYTAAIGDRVLLRAKSATVFTVHFRRVAGDASRINPNTFLAAQVFSDQSLSRGMFKDCGYTVVDKGNISNATVTFDYTAGSVQTYTATGSTVTWAFSNWPPTGNLGELLIIGTNMGAYTHTISGLTWTLLDGTTTTSVATFLAQNGTRTAFRTSGVDKILLVTRNAGTTVYASLVSL